MQPLNPMEVNMQYKKMILELLQDQPEVYDQLRKERKLMSTMEQYSRELKASHQVWQEFLSQLRPGSDPSQVASEALELALNELENRLPSASHQDKSEKHFLDAAMLFVRRLTPRG
jgi:DNA repair ATPase RecN